MTADFDLAAPLPDGTVLLEASAGTGKTFSIAQLAIRYIAERRVSIEKLLVVTFTEAATRELSERIRARIRDAIEALDGRPADDPVLQAWVEASLENPEEAKQRRLHLALAFANFDAASISTIHGFCRRVLSQAAFESSADDGAELITDVSQIHRDLVFDEISKALAKLSPEEYELLGKMGTVGTLSALVGELVRNPKARILPEKIGKAEAQVRFLACLDDLREAFRTGGAQLQSELERAIADDLLKDKAKKNPELVRRAFRALEARRSKNGFFDGQERALFGLLAHHAFLNAKKKSSWGALATDPVLAALTELVDADAALSKAVQLELAFAVVAEVRENLRDRKRKLGIVDFDDLLRLVEAAVAIPDSPLVKLLRERYDVALIDEFQDTDPVQWTIFRAIFHDAKKPLWLIGDPKQAIYSFRGADLEVYFQARESAHARFRLGTNHRSDRPLVDAVNRLFCRFDRSFKHPQLGYEAVQAAKEARLLVGNRPIAPLRIQPVTKPASKGDGIVTWVANEVLGFLQSDATIQGRPVTPRDCAVLVGTNSRARAIRDALREIGVPSVLLSDESVFSSDEAADLGAFLRALAMPRSLSRIVAFLATRTAGFDASQIDAVRGDEKESASWSERFEAWGKLYATHGFLRAVRAMASEQRVETRFASMPGGDRRLADFFHAAELLDAAQRAEELDPEQLALFLERERAEERENGAKDEARKVRLETDADAVEIVTVHRSKGLEYPVVFCADLFDERFRKDAFPLRYSQNGERVLHLMPKGDDDALSLARHGALEESLRLAYVALTRAKHYCAVLYHPGPKSSVRMSALDWLFFGHLDEKAYQKACANPLDPLEDAFGATEGIEIAPQGFVPRRERFERSSSDASTLAPADYHGQEPLDSLWRWASFSSIVGSRKAEGFVEEKEDDEGVGAVELGDETLPPRIEALEGASTTAHLADFKYGKELGSLVHQVFEKIDFAHPGDLKAAIEERLPTFGLESRLRKSPGLVADLAKMIEDTLATEIVAHDDRFTLSEIGKGDRQSEMRFAFSVREHTLKDLAGVLKKHSPDRTEFAEAIEKMRADAVVGLVHGGMDLVFRRGGRYYVADFKTNHLGKLLGHYHPTRLAKVMHQGYYRLQGYLYALALHRHLSRRLRDYDPAVHFGGIFFFFVRGMTPATGSRFGIHFDPGSAALLGDLDELFSKGGKA